MKKIYCVNCDKDTKCKLKEKNDKKIIDNIEIEYLKKEYICSECNEEVYDAEIFDYNVKSVNDKLREKTELIRTCEIEEILKKYNIGKKPLSLLLGFGEIQIIRYLKSGNISKEHSDVLKSIKDNPFIFEGYIYENKDKVTDNAFKKALGKVKQLELADCHSKIYQISMYLLKKYEDTTDMALQKILYFVNGFSKKFLGDYLFCEPVEAWKHGPVYRELYEAFSYYKRKNIDYSELTKDRELNLNPDEIEYLDKVLPFFACYSGSVLRNMSHLTIPWQKARIGLNEEEPSDRIIESEDIDNYFYEICVEYNINKVEDISKYATDLLNKTLHNK